MELENLRLVFLIICVMGLAFLGYVMFLYLLKFMWYIAKLVFKD